MSLGRRRVNYHAVRGDVCLGSIVSYFGSAISLWPLHVGYLTVTVPLKESLSFPAVTPNHVRSVGSPCRVCEHPGFILGGAQATSSYASIFRWDPLISWRGEDAWKLQGGGPEKPG